MQRSLLRPVRTRLLTVFLASVLVTSLNLWLRSYTVEDELRWMYGGVHLHLESAEGYITFVSTSGCPSADYFVWASSPDLSYGRAADWYKADPAGLPRWH